MAHVSPYRIVREGDVFTLRFTANEITNGLLSGGRTCTHQHDRLQFKDKGAGGTMTVTFAAFGTAP